jgi:dTDP-4-amino-4,6-dideoxygalactose transaminase
LEDTAGITLLRYDEQTTVAFNFVVLVDQNRRSAVVEALKRVQIGSGIHYPPNHLQPAFHDYAVSLPVTERAYRRMLTLPLFPDLKCEDVDVICDHVRSVLD